MSLITGKKVKTHTSQGIVKNKCTKPLIKINKNIIKQKQNIRTKTNRGKTFINI
jgi:hypothetical protein